MFARVASSLSRNIMFFPPFGHFLLNATERTEDDGKRQLESSSRAPDKICASLAQARMLKACLLAVVTRIWTWPCVQALPRAESDKDEP